MFLKLDLQVSSINLQGFFLFVRKSPDFQVGRSAMVVYYSKYSTPTIG